MTVRFRHLGVQGLKGFAGLPKVVAKVLRPARGGAKGRRGRRRRAEDFRREAEARPSPIGQVEAPGRPIAVQTRGLPFLLR